MDTQKPREIAARVLCAHLTGGDFIENRLNAQWDLSSIGDADRRFVHELVLGVIRQQALLDWLIQRKAKRGVAKKAITVLLRMGLYQIFFMDRVPDHAAVNETVALSKVLRVSHQTGFINALLRAYLRDREAAVSQIGRLRRDKVSVGYSHPHWLCKRWQSRWNQEDLVRLLDWNNSPAPTYARVNTLQANRSDLELALKEENVDFEWCQFPWAGDEAVLRLFKFPALADLSSYQKGMYYIQDPSTLLAVNSLDPKPGERILDLCAAPGGKTTQIAQRMKNQGVVVARDVDQKRLSLLGENCQRLGATCVKNESQPPPEDAVFRVFDRVLVDVPCSNTGVMRRRVDLRWRLRPAVLDRMQALQRRLLAEGSRFVKPGGVLIYSTCSLEPSENQDVVREFLNQHPEFTLEDQKQLLPFRDQVDGAFVARLVLKRDGND